MLKEHRKQRNEPRKGTRTPSQKGHATPRWAPPLAERLSLGWQVVGSIFSPSWLGFRPADVQEYILIYPRQKPRSAARKSQNLPGRIRGVSAEGGSVCAVYHDAVLRCPESP